MNNDQKTKINTPTNPMGNAPKPGGGNPMAKVMKKKK